MARDGRRGDRAQEGSPAPARNEPPTQGRRRPSEIAWWAGALVLHAALSLVLSVLAGDVAERAAPSGPRAPLDALELAFVELEPPRAAEAGDAHERPGDHGDATPPESASPGAAAPESGSARASDTEEARELGKTKSAIASARAGGAPEATAQAPAEQRTHRRLSLADLGVGAPLGTVVGEEYVARREPVPRRPARTPEAARIELAERRLERSMTQAQVDRDQRLGLGLGPGGPVLKALGAATRASTAPPNSSALFVARIDQQGRLVDLRFLGGTHGAAVWQSVAERAGASLDGKRLKVPSGAHGMKLELAVESRVQLPSGRDPGVDIDLFGIPLERGAGDRSTKIALLNPIPKLELIDVPNEEEVQSGADANSRPRTPAVVLKWDLLSVDGDPADIGATPQRIVRAYVVKSQVE